MSNVNNTAEKRSTELKIKLSIRTMPPLEDSVILTEMLMG